MAEAEADEPNSNNSSSHADDEDTSEAALEAMMAFQEQQEQQAVDHHDHDDEASMQDDDPNIVFLLQQDDEHQPDEYQPVQEDPNNNPAAVALRARLAQTRQLNNNNRTNKSLYARLANLFSYSTWSFLSAALLIFHTMRTRQQFYLTVLYLQSSKLSYIVLGNAVIAMGVSTFGFVTAVFLDGGLRVNERDAIGEHIRWDVTETCLALTIFRSEMDVGTAVRFLWLVVLKCLHWSVELRGGHLRMTEEVFIYPEENESTSNTSNTTNQQQYKSSWYKRLPRFRLSHLRYYTLLYILTIVDIVSVAHCALSVATDGPSVSILFGFESAILLVSALSGLSLYHVHVVDGIMGFLHHVAEGEHHYHAVGALAVVNDAEESQRIEGGASDEGETTETATNEEATSNTASTTSDQATPPQRQKTLAKTLVERIANPWKNRRATLTFAIELQAQAAKFLFYVVFFAIVFTYYGMPINIFREVYVSFQQLRRRLIAFNNYRRLTYNMDRRFESIQDEEELDRLGHTCIICRDTMDLSGGCKKLPICGHAFHTHCLREWLVQQQSCPTCRADIAANEARRKRQLEREADEAAAAGEEEGTVVETAEGGSDEVVMETREIVDENAAAEAGVAAAPPDGNAAEAVASPQSKTEEPTAQKSDTPASSTLAPAESGDLVPGWVEEWDPVSNRTYYWNKDTNETSWTRPVLPTDVVSQFNAMLHRHNTDRQSQLRQRDILQERQNAVAANAVSHVNNVPCLYRIKNPLGAPVFERHGANSTRVVPHGKIIVCISVEYWTETGASMFRMPDGYINSVEVEKFLELDFSPAVSALGVNIHAS
ncbi:hypothetical protein ACHAXN_007799 [Cyclotella atomus]